MAYCTYNDIAAEFKALTFTTSTPVTPAKVTEFIAQADATINGMIGNKYVTPVAGTESLLILKYISIKIVSQRISVIMEVKTPKDENNQLAREAKELTPMEMLKAIAEGDLILSDATLKDSKNGVSAYSIKHCIPNTFKKGCDQW